MEALWLLKRFADILETGKEAMKYDENMVHEILAKTQKQLHIQVT